MKANFALSLTEDGVRLFQRVSRGWAVVGEVAHADPEASAKMAALRREALAREPSGLRTKLLIPNEQIKYISLQNPIATTAEIDAALQNATAYPISEIVHDHSRDENQTFVAAVTRETLDEAEKFAETHHFMPVCFAAVPEKGTYVGEVFFGRTLAALSLLGPGQVIERDDVPVSLTDDLADLPPSPDASAQAPVEDSTPEESFAEIYDEMVQPPLSEPVSEAPQASDVTTPRQSASARFTPMAVLGTGDADSAAEEDPAAPTEPVLFAHTISDTPAPPPEAKALFGAKRDDDSTAQPDPADVASRLTKAAGRLAKTISATSPATDEQDTPATGSLKALFASTRTKPATAPEPRNEPLVRKDPPAVQPAMLPPVPPPAPFASRPTAGNEERRFTVFGARDRQPRSMRDPRFLSLLASSIILAFAVGYLGFAGWDRLSNGAEPELSSVEPVVAEIPPEAPQMPSETDGRSFDPVSEQPVTAVQDPTFPAPDATTPALPDVADTATQSAAAAPEAEQVPVIAGRVLTPDEAQTIYQRTGVWQRAPRFAAIPQILSEESGAGAPISMPTASQEVLPLPVIAGSTPDPVMLAPLDPPPAGTSFARDARGFILATAEGTQLPNGVTVYAGQPDVPFRARPGTELPPDPPSLQPGAQITESGALLLAVRPVVTPPNRPAGIAPEPAVETPPEPEAAAEATAITPAETEATVDPAPIDPETGLPLTIIEGSPDLPPPNRPAGLAPERIIDPETGLPISITDEPPAVLPPARPDGLAPEETAPPDQTDATNATDATTGVDEALADATSADDEALADADLVALFDNPGGVGFAALQPPARPSGLVATAPSWSRADLGTGSPPARPADLIASALPDNDVLAISAALNSATTAVASSDLVPDLTIVPEPRPRNFDQIVANVRQIAATRPVAASQAAAPSGSVPRSVADAATEEAAISLRGLALLGIFESGGNRTALVRLPNGRITRVGSGDRLDGGQVASIGQTSLTYRSGGRTLTLEMP